MKNFVQNMILVIALTIVILFSYAYVQNKVQSMNPSELYHLLKNELSILQSENNKTSDHLSDKPDTYHAVWVSYLEFNSYRNSVKTNNETAFREFFQRILDQCAQYDINHVIVHVRPFGDALYQSEYFPWAACISGKQGKNPGYDPLNIMIELAHKNNIKIEAWINPYRISTGADISELSDDNKAKIWSTSSTTERNVLTYENALYYNPASKDVQDLINHGVKEIVEKYDVDGIHMDDYFYPTFTKDNYDKVFDAVEYEKAIKEYVISSNTSIADWRRDNVNTLVSTLYQTIKSIDNNVIFGISPAGNLSNLRSNLEYYTDIDTWVEKEGYIDYIMPQIYWGFTNEQAPFEETLEQWIKLTKKSKVRLYIGLQLYRMGTTDQEQSDYEELQSAELITKQLNLLKTKSIAGYCLFSYQYLDADCKTYQFDSNEFSESRKKLLKQIATELKNRRQKSR